MCTENLTTFLDFNSVKNEIKLTLFMLHFIGNLMQLTDDIFNSKRVILSLSYWTLKLRSVKVR